MKVKLMKPHTHKRIAYTPGPEGIEIDVSAHEAKQLHDAGVTDKAAARSLQKSTADTKYGINDLPDGVIDVTRAPT